MLTRRENRSSCLLGPGSTMGRYSRLDFLFQSKTKWPLGPLEYWHCIALWREKKTKLLRTQEIYRDTYFNLRNIVHKSAKDVQLKMRQWFQRNIISRLRTFTKHYFPRCNSFCREGGVASRVATNKTSTINNIL